MSASDKGKRKPSKVLVSEIRNFFFTEDNARALSTTDIGRVYVAPSFKAKKTKLEAGIDWLTFTFEPILRKYLGARMIHSEDVWANFTALFIDDEGKQDSEEWQFMSKRQKEVHDAWLKRPAILRKTKPRGATAPREDNK